MKLILGRHGNTFEEGQVPVYIGACEDLPLTKTGIEQAKYLGQTFKRLGIKIADVYSGSLRRTLDYANYVIKELGSLKPIIDPRLNEFDYGAWSGLSQQSIRDQWGDGALNAWEQQAQSPKNARWSPQSDEMFARIRAFSEQLLSQYQDQTVLVITSQGCLRFFLRLSGHLTQVKVATGNICQLIHQDHWHLVAWNQKPEDLNISVEN
jgi:broad specificity phosphatase PhoE